MIFKFISNNSLHFVIGPTSFAPVIDAAIDIVERNNGQYHVLVIIADGQVLSIHFVFSILSMMCFGCFLSYISILFPERLSFPPRLREILVHRKESLVHKNKQQLIP
jgi:hypothetical protein